MLVGICCLVRTKFWSKKLLSRKKHLVEKYLVGKNFWSEFFLVRKKLLVHTIDLRDQSRLLALTMAQVPEQNAGGKGRWGANGGKNLAVKLTPIFVYHKHFFFRDFI